MIVCDKFAMHLPLTRQSRAFAAEGIALDVSTLADWVGRACATLAPLQGTHPARTTDGSVYF